MKLPYRSAGNAQSWRFDRKPQDASLRYQQHGPIVPLETPGFLARLFGPRP